MGTIVNCSIIISTGQIMEPVNKFLYKHKGCYFVKGASPESIDSLESFEIKDDDIFIITYPKSGKFKDVFQGRVNLVSGYNIMVAATLLCANQILTFGIFLEVVGNVENKAVKSAF